MPFPAGAIAAAAGRAAAAAERRRSSGRPLLASFRFQIYIPGAGPLGFSGVSGLEVGLTEESIAQSTTRLPLKLPGDYIYGDVTMERGAGDGSSLQDWIEQVKLAVSVFDVPPQAVANYKRDVTVSVLDRVGDVAIKYIVHGAWPKKLSYSPLNAVSSDVLIQSVVLACDWISVT